MADRRLPFSVKDDEGVARRGELIIARAWRPDIELSPTAAFTIVLARQPLAADSPPPTATAVAVCAPATAVRLAAAVAEPAVAYEAGDTPAPLPLRLPRRALAAYAEGALWAARPLSVGPREVFSAGTGHPRLDAVARDLLAASRRAEACWRALDQILSWPRPPTRIARPERLRTRLRGTLGRMPSLRSDASGHEALWAGAVARLADVAAGTPPEGVAPSPAALAEDVAFVRCLAERPDAAADLATMRAYLERAKPGPQMPALLVDHAVTREQLSFITLLSEPRRLDGMRTAFETFRAAYAVAYAEHHRRYWGGFARLRAALQEATPPARALVRLNSLRGLGPPLGRAALAAYQRLARGQIVCSIQNPEAALRDEPTCPACRITMEDSVPRQETDEVLRRLRTALARQQARLASEAVRRILARGGERIEQFLQIVQASDLAGLAQVLDDDLLAFLRELLAQPVAPAPEALDLLQELVRTHPLVGEEQVEAVAQTLRRLLIDKLASQREADPSRPAAVHLASAPPPPP